MEKWNNQKTTALIKALLALNKDSEARNFLRDLLTERELVEFGNRWKAAQMLNQKLSYPEIQKATGLSTRTIARISDWLQNGKGGYQSMLKKLNHRQNSSHLKKKF